MPLSGNLSRTPGKSIAALVLDRSGTRPLDSRPRIYVARKAWTSRRSFLLSTNFARGTNCRYSGLQILHQVPMFRFPGASYARFSFFIGVFVAGLYPSANIMRQSTD